MPVATADFRSGRAYRVLRNRDYRLLFAGDAVSTAGSQIQRTAVAWQVFRLTDDPLQLGLLGLCRFLPAMLFSIAGGVVADRGDRRRTLFATQLLLLACSATLAVLTWAGAISMPAIYALVALASVVDSVANPTRQALIPLLVPREELPAASTMNLIEFHTALIGGPAIGGILIAWLGVSSAYFVDAVSFGAVIFAVVAMRARPELPPAMTGGLEAAREGLHFLRRSPVLLGVMVTDFFGTFFGFSSLLMPIFAEKVLHAGPRGLGLLLAAPAVGGVAAAIVLAIVPLPNRAGLTVLVSVALYGGAMTGFGLSTTLWISLACLALSGIADSVSMTLRHAMRNLLTPDALRGRVASVHRMLSFGGPQLGEFEAGLLAAAIGAGPAVAVGGVATIVTAFAAVRIVPEIGSFRLSTATRADVDPVRDAAEAGARQAAEPVSAD